MARPVNCLEVATEASAAAYFPLLARPSWPGLTRGGRVLPVVAVFRSGASEWKPCHYFQHRPGTDGVSRDAKRSGGC